MELSLFVLTFVVNEKLKVNSFKAGLNPNLKEIMLVRQYISYMDRYDIVINMKRVMKEKNEYYNE